MKQIAKILFCILCINILGLSYKPNAVVKGEEVIAMSSGEASYTVEDYREEKSEEITSTRFLMESATVTTGEELIINAIMTGIKNKETQIDLTPYVSYMVNVYDALDLYFETLDKYPELFYTSATTVSGSYYKDTSGEIAAYTVRVTYTVNSSEIDAMVQAYNNKVTDIKTNYTNPLYGELKNEYIAHDYILENTTYDTASVVPDIAHTAYGALINRVAVCDGYAKAMKQLLNDCGIESEIVTNTAADHAWNYVKIEGQYYHLDATWNDPVKETNATNYNHFNLSDTALSKVANHSINTSLYPVCTSNDFDFLRTSYMTNGYYSKRVGDKLYYTNSLGDLRSMDLKGTNDTLVYEGLNFRNFEGYKSKLYVNNYIKHPDTGLWVSIVKSFNLINGQIKIEYLTDQDISDIYKKNSDLIIEKSGGSKDTVSLVTMKEDINEDGLIDIEDLANVANRYNMLRDSSAYLSSVDINSDGIIDIYDITIISVQI